MEPQNRRDAQAREQARRRRAKQVQRRRLVLAIAVLGLIVLIVGLIVGLSGDDETATRLPVQTTQPENGENMNGDTELESDTFTAELTGDQSVPPVQTRARAVLTLEYDADDRSMSYVLEVVSAITNPSVATIYQGAPGTSGAAIVTLFAGPPETGSFQGELAQGTIEDGDLIGPLEGETVEDLVRLMLAGETYVSIGNASYPVDAIRGHIE